MMTKEQTLRKAARESCRFRGHNMAKSWSLSYFYGRQRQSLSCKDCSMAVVIALKPAPNSIDIGGQAVAMHCDKINVDN